MEQATVLAGIIIAIGIIMSGGAIGSAIGDGLVTSKTLEGIARQPELRGTLIRYMFLFIGLIESFPFIVLAFALFFLFAPPYLNLLK